MKKSIFYSHILTMSRQESISVEEALAFTRSVGYEGLDTDWADLREDPDGFLNRIHAADMKIASVNVFCDFPGGFSHDEMTHILQTIARCGCTKAMIIPGFYTKNGDTQAETDRILYGLRETCAIAKEFGLTVSIEDFDNPLSPCGRFQDIRKLLDGVPELMHTLDTGNYAFFQEDVLSALSSLCDRIVHVHLKDRSLTPFLTGEEPILSISGTPLYSAPVGWGFIPIGTCINALARIGYNGYMSAEFFGAADMRAYITKSAEKIDALLSHI